jgi:hypothetical protein
VAALGEKRSCSRCHAAAHQSKTRESATACTSCHPNILDRPLMAQAASAAEQGWADSYWEAMHTLCIGCHQKRPRNKAGSAAHDSTQCAHCHRQAQGTLLPQGAPFVSAKGGN